MKTGIRFRGQTARAKNTKSLTRPKSTPTTEVRSVPIILTPSAARYLKQRYGGRTKPKT
jgi:hypothetical protein